MSTAEEIERSQGLNRRPDGVDDATVEAVGKVSEALEALEEARGRLYGFHRLLGRADLLLGDGCELLRKAGHDDVAERLEREVLGRNVLRGRWTFQIVEDFDDNYWSVFRDEERRVRERLQQGVRHVYEAEMKQDRRSEGRPAHEATPEDT